MVRLDDLKKRLRAVAGIMPRTKEEKLKLQFLGLLSTQIDHLFASKNLGPDTRQELLTTIKGYKAIEKKVFAEAGTDKAGLLAEEKDLIEKLEALIKAAKKADDAFLETVLDLREELIKVVEHELY